MINRQALVQQFYDAWVKRDWESVARAVVPGVQVRTPIDRVNGVDEYKEKCWPHGEGLVDIRIDTYLEQGDTSMFTYDAVTKDKRFRVAEQFRFDGDRIREIEIYWGDLPK